MASIDPENRETAVLDRLVDFTGANVLEIGAGDGRFTWRFADRARSVLALEALETELRKARTATPEHLRERIRFEVADATTFDYPRNRFDIAVLSYSL